MRRSQRGLICFFLMNGKIDIHSSGHVVVLAPMRVGQNLHCQEKPVKNGDPGVAANRVPARMAAESRRGAKSGRILSGLAYPRAAGPPCAPRAEAILTKHYAQHLLMFPASGNLNWFGEIFISQCLYHSACADFLIENLLRHFGFGGRIHYQ
ncbi:MULTISPECIES: hypothetical protein [Methylobacterium]|uniref:hypothetical protein n=1 Tax=Methylobacterium TaxID=407 RepID=UPI0013EB1944|nr:hypothetical protein [Methylobacterium sp. DB0501]NGM34044.1 hypothetical protein [Methylobacterium sp. DB0501]